MAVLQVLGLNKSYKGKKVIRDLSLELNKGEIMGLIGANGAGKTTIFKSILGLVKKDSGSIIVNQQQTREKSKAYLNTIGSIIEYPTFYESLTASQNLAITSKLYDELDLSKQDILNYLELVGLEGEGDSKVASFSLGMKQRLGLAQALIHQPSILLLDEPFNGLDPKGIKELRDFLSSLSGKGIAIIISSHSLEELNKIVDTVTIIHQGKLIFQGKKAEYLALGAEKNIWLLETDNKLLTEDILKALNISFKTKDEHFELSLPKERAEEVRNQLLSELLGQKVSILKISEQQNNFEDIFLNIQTTGEVDYDKVNKN